jgi:hypothetical protein
MAFFKWRSGRQEMRPPEGADWGDIIEKKCRLFEISTVEEV